MGVILAAVAAPRFEIRRRDPASRARLGTLDTPHGIVETPAFAPVGTRGTVKAMLPRDLAALGVKLFMANAYHLSVRPGIAAVAKLGGLHALAGWSGPMMTDSGGYQIFSLAQLRSVDSNGVTFRDPLDGVECRFTPESVMEIQESLGADLVLPLDVCTPYPADRDRAEADLALTHNWAERSVEARTRTDQSLFAIVQGSTYADLRAQSAMAAAALDVDGFAVGGVSVGEPKEAMREAIDASTATLPTDRPIHLLGVGHLDDIVDAVALGIDTFDCVMPTRVARNGRALTPGGRLNLRNAEHAQDPRPIDASCPCYTCEHFSRGALRHWLKAGEILPLTLLTLHNLQVVSNLMAEIRASLAIDQFSEYRSHFGAVWAGSNGPDDAASGEAEALVND